MYLIYIPVAVLFVAFVITGGILMPLWEITEGLRDRRRPRGPAPDHSAEIIELPTDRRIAA